MFAFNVWSKNKLIDTVFYSISSRQTIAEAVEMVRDSLISHDGYSSDIKVTWPKGQRVTCDVWEIHGLYGHGWEMVTAEDTRKEARQRLKEYRDNEPNTAFKIVFKMERK